MKYTLEMKKEIINGKPDDMSVIDYCKQISISNSSYYKWVNELNSQSIGFVDVTNKILDDTSTSFIEVNINGINIKVTTDFNELLLTKIIRVLKTI